MPDDPNHIVVAKYHYFDDGKPVALKINVYNGRKDVLSVPPFAQGRLLANHRGIVRVGIEVDYDESFDRSTIYVKQGGGWNRLAYPTPGKTSIEPVYLDERRQELFVFSARETGKTGLYRVDLQTGESQPVFVHERVDIDELITDRGRIVGLVYEDGSPILAILDQDSVKMQEYKRLQKLFPDELVTELNFTKDYSKAVFQVKSDRNPGDYYLYDVEQKTVRFLAQKRPGIDPKDMGPRLPVAIPARDGLRLDGYVTLPKDQKLKSQLPMIVLPHGGPFYVRDQWSFDPEAHFFASRGYAVLQVNFRGSEGYGIDFARAGHRQWGKAMQDDLTDATHWAIDEGIADPDRVCIFGGSYGGYAALMGVVKEPDLYRCAISYVGVSDLNLMHQVGDANDTAAGLKYLEKTLGPEGGGLARYSPAQHADKIKAPVFIVHGADDQRVPIDHAEVMRDALKKAGTSFELLVKPYEGHGFTQFPNRLEAYHKMLRFIEQSMSQASERHGMAG
jgi:dipeptidyl aminopeptidase/acylaminoacyl peptidase